MDIFDILEETYIALSANKARSGLTILGIVIGISSVIAMISIGAGASAAISAHLARRCASVRASRRDTRRNSQHSKNAHPYRCGRAGISHCGPRLGINRRQHTVYTGDKSKAAH